MMINVMGVVVVRLVGGYNNFGCSQRMIHVQLWLTLLSRLMTGASRKHKFPKNGKSNLKILSLN